MNQLNIRIDEDRADFEPGETIRVHLDWSLSDEPTSLEVRAIWNTVGKGTRDSGIEHAHLIDSPRHEDSRVIDFTLPVAPYSFSGTLVSLVWALELVAIPSRKTVRTEITIAPRAAEIVLTQVATK